MIQTEGGYRTTLEALSHLEQALASMSRRKAEYGPNFALFAEPVVDHILRLRAEIDAYTGLSAYLAAYGGLKEWNTDDADATDFHGSDP